MTERKSGFVALIGRPNVGKSTLINRLVGQKIAIMSDKPQTTRNRIRGILTREEGQVVFLDTPGIHRPHHRLGQYMVDIAESAMRDVDLIVLLVDVSQSANAADDEIVERVKQTQNPVLLVLNKIDAIPKEKLLAMIDRYRVLASFIDIIPISARTGEQVEDLVKVIFDHLPTGPFYYPEGVVTDHPEQFIIAELIREKVLLLTREEVPHSIAVGIEQLEYRGDRETLYINAVIYTERDSQKGILIGKGGDMLKRVGMMARQDVEKIFGGPAFIELWVRVKKDWRNRENMLRNFGFDKD